MSRFENVTKKFVDAINRHDPNAVANVYANDCVVHDPFYPAPLVGRDAVKEDAAAFIRAFPDLRFELLNLAEKGEVGAGEIRITGTNTGPLATPMGEIPPTGKRMDLRGASFLRIGGQDLIVEERRYYDTGVLMRQLGLAPEPAEMAAH